MDDQLTALPDSQPDSNESDYQNKLDQLASEIKPEPPFEPPVNPPTPPTPLPPLPPHPPVSEPEFSSVNNLPPPPVPTKPTTNIFKYIFFVSLIIFLTIAALVVNSLIGQPSNPSGYTSTPSTVPATATPSLDQSCELNDQILTVGQSFPAADGCNTCTCQPDLTISCTEIDCGNNPDLEL